MINIKNLWRWMRKLGLANYIILVFFPFVGRQNHFVMGVSAKSYARARIGWASPLAASGVWVLAMNNFFRYLSDKNFEGLVKQLGANEAYSRTSLGMAIVRYETILIIVGGISIWALVRWGYHRIARHILEPWEKVQRVPLKYYLVSTSSIVLFFGLFGWLFALLVRFYNGDIRPVADFVGEGALVVLLLCCGLAIHVALWNAQQSRKELYGKFSGIVGLVPCVVFIPLVILLQI
ncbi:hypothetical protein XA1311A_06340 [Xanthomonas arboricola]|uniref:hypothetical protein n=1 Tax=Xanthomonas arboricola TaxID=56448 RepID=UPI001E544FF8|nr:hypothetical protein [Xanthomonas arboricola]CAE6709250.1 hypothetical protein XA1311A_06340 [Xanthomonas arboricola]CAE6709276.1 hypothetical protein XA1311A_06340 [Xanthomonas arboricola]